MLVNTHEIISEIQDTLLKMNESGHLFCLTGKRFFNNTQHDNNWDFIAENNLDVEEFLSKLGFKVNKEYERYLDSMTTKVMTKYFYDYKDSYYRADKVMTKYECPKINVFICHEFKKKLKVRDIIKESFTQPLSIEPEQEAELYNLIRRLLND